MIIALEPNADRESEDRAENGYEFVNKVTVAASREYIPSVDAGLQRRPLDDRVPRRLSDGRPQVTLLDGAYHDVDSSELAFKIAGSMAFKEAARKASPCCWSR